MNVVASIDQLTLDKPVQGKVLLAGDVVFASLKNKVLDGYVLQSQIEASNNLVRQLTRKSETVYLSVHERLFAANKGRFAMAVESYIAWGLKRSKKGTTILYGGASTPNRTNVTIIVFSEGSVVEIDDRELPQASASYFNDSLTQMHAEIVAKYPTAQYFQASPLDDWKVPGIEYVGVKPLSGASYRPLSRGFSKSSAFVVPAIVGVCGLLFYIGAIGIGWGKYTKAISDYEVAISDPSIKSQGGIDTKFLNVVTARRAYMLDPRRQSALSEKTAFVVRGIGAVADVKILQLKLPAPSINPQRQAGISVSPDQAKQRKAITPERIPDVWLSIAVPKSGTTGIDQGKATMSVIANATGMSLRLPHQGWREELGRRIYNIEGFIHD